jgi:peptide chain release factor 2
MHPDTHTAVETIKTAVILLKRHVDWDRALQTLSRLETEIAQPSFWDNQKNAQKVMREKNHLDSQVAAIRHLEDTLGDQTDLIDLATEEGDEDMVAEAEAAISELAVLAGKKQLESLLSGEADANNCFLEIHPGAWWYRSPGLGSYALAHVCKMGGCTRVSNRDNRRKFR